VENMHEYYRVNRPETPRAAAAEDATADELADMPLDELRDLAKTNGIENADELSQSELADAIMGVYRAPAPEAPKADVVEPIALADHPGKRPLEELTNLKKAELKDMANELGVRVKS